MHANALLISSGEGTYSEIHSLEHKIAFRNTKNTVWLFTCDKHYCCKITFLDLYISYTQ